MSLTLRELRNRMPVRVAVALVALTVFLAITGPFGTYDALPLLPRAVYWAVVVIVSVALRWAVIWVQHRLAWRSFAMERVVDVIYAALLAGVISVGNSLFFGFGPSMSGFLVLFGTVLAISAVISVISYFFFAAEDDGDDDGAGQGFARFMRRLPVDKRGTLIRIAAEDHYLRVVTEKGEAMILMRLVDAEAELGPDEGMRVHRSHWIVPGAVVSSQRYRGQTRLMMQDGFEVPVSRSHQDEVIAAGLI